LNDADGLDHLIRDALTRRARKIRVRPDLEILVHRSELVAGAGDGGEAFEVAIRR
jgi:hypothetical protein